MNSNDLELPIQEFSNLTLKATKSADITITIDTSGSMDHRKQFILDGVKEIVQKQKALFEDTPYECTITISTFSSCGKYKTLFRCMPIYSFTDLNPKNITCDGMTAFYDAIISTLNLKFSEETDKIHVFISDGEENDSKAKAKDVKSKISSLESNISIIYFGSNQPIHEISDKLGIDQNCSMPYYDGSDNDRTPSAFNVCGDVLCRALSSDNKIRFTKEEFDLLNSKTPTGEDIDDNKLYNDMQDDSVPSKY